MKTKNLVLMALLIGIGTALYMVIPGFSGGMKPDFMLTMMFIGILLFRDMKSVIVLSLATGVLSGLFTTFPGGFIPNVIDKTVTGLVFFAVVMALGRFAGKLPAATVLAGLGTLLSGTIFLSVAIFALGADFPFSILFVSVVLPAIVMNGVAFFIIYPIVMQLAKRSAYQTAPTH
ncbi:tryptophan transporter [Bhargavaea cecembensis]|uniref:tryptophan transporter n=1 Tax=Bhargavaea cecembensis TaxID=394098 RepID=UPI00058BE8E3|nr:tryptophan transporter [Bhargavaea cecembensis]